MTKPTEEKIGECGELIKSHFRQYGNSASETRLASLIYSIQAVLSGDGQPAADHAAALEAARLARKPAAPAAPEEPSGTFATNRPTAEPAPAPEPEPEPTPEPAAEEIESDEDFYTEDELNEMTVEQLRELAAEGGLEFNSKATKVDIIKAIMAAE